MLFKTRETHIPIDVNDCVEVTVNGRGSLESEESSRVVDAFNALAFEKIRGRLTINDRIGIHIYLRSGTDIHVYPRDDGKVDVVRIEGDIRVRYVAGPKDAFLSTLVTGR